MAIYKARSKMQEDSGVSTEDFPALVHAWVPNSILLEGRILYEPVGRADLTFTGGEPTLTNSTITTAPGGLGAPVTSPGTKKVLMFSAGKFTSSKSISIGDPIVTDGIGVGTITNYTNSDDGDYIQNDALSAESFVRVIGVTVDWANDSSRTFSTDASGNITWNASNAVQGTGDGTIADGANFTNPDTTIVTNNVQSWYGMYVFYMDTMITEAQLTEAIEAFHANPTTLPDVLKDIS